jgi:hypothetical protein
MMLEIGRNYVEAQGTTKEKRGIQADKFARIRLTGNSANMPRSLLRGALFDFDIDIFECALPDNFDGKEISFSFFYFAKSARA